MNEAVGGLKIFQVYPCYYPRRGGVEKVVKSLSDNFFKKGNDVEVISADSPNGRVEEVIDGVRVNRTKRPLSPWFGLSLDTLFLLNRKKDELKRSVVHLHSYHVTLTLEAMLFCKLNSIDFIISPHYHGQGHSAVTKLFFSAYRKLMRRLLPLSDKIICVSEFERSLLVRDFRGIASKMVVIPNGVNEVTINKKSHDRLRLLYIGRIVQYKGLDRLIDVAAALNAGQTPFRLNIIGQGPYLDGLTARINSRSLQEDVAIVPSLSDAELEDEYNDADIFLLFSEAEAYGLVVAEALIHGVPCIISGHQALDEFRGQPGCFVVDDACSAGEIAGLIQELRGKNWVVGPFGNKITTWDLIADQYLEVYSNAA